MTSLPQNLAEALRRSVRRVGSQGDPEELTGVLGQAGSGPIQVPGEDGMVYVTLKQGAGYRGIIKAAVVDGGSLVYQVDAPVRLSRSSSGQYVVRINDIETQAWATAQGRPKQTQGAITVSDASQSVQADGVQELIVRGGSVSDEGDGVVAINVGGFKGFTAPNIILTNNVGRSFYKDSYTPTYGFMYYGLTDAAGTDQLAMDQRAFTRVNAGVACWEMIEFQISGFLPDMATGECGCGFGLRDNTNGDIVGIFARADGIIYYEEWTDTSTRSAQHALGRVQTNGFWGRIGINYNSSDVEQAVIAMISPNGAYWGQVVGAAIGSTVFSGGTVDQLGYLMNFNTATYSTGVDTMWATLNHYVRGYMFADDETFTDLLTS